MSSEIDSNRIELIAFLSHGRWGLAQRLATDNTLLQEMLDRSRLFVNFLTSDLNQRLAWIEHELKERDYNASRNWLAEVIDELGIIFHRLLQRDLVWPQELRADNLNYDLIALREKFDIISTARQNLYQKINPKMIFKNLALNL